MNGEKYASSINEQIFEQPSGKVRGLVTAFIKVGGKEKRIAHATLLTTGADIALDVPKKMKADEIQAVAKLLVEFAERVQSLSA